MVFDPDTVACRDKEWANDLPGGGKRFVTPSDGVAATIVSGEVLYENGSYNQGVLPGAMLRSYDA